MRITRISSDLLNVPTGKLITDSTHSLENVEVVTCNVETDQGLDGFGFTYTIGTGGYAIKAALDSIFAKMLLGSNAEETDEIWARMWKGTHAVGRGGITTHAMAAVDIALWDLKGKALDMPLYKLLGGSSKAIPLYDTNGGWLHYNEEELVSAAVEAAERKFHGFKLKVGKKTLAEDVARIKVVQAAVGKKMPVMVDANQVWGKRGALERGRAFQDLGVYWYEEPMIADDIWGHKEVAASLDVPIAVGETIFTRHEFENYLKLKACDILQQDVCRVGGITEWMEIAKLAEINGVKVSPHFVMDLHPALVASIPNGLFVEYIPWLRKLFKDPPRIADGTIFPPEAPGIGLDLNTESLEKYAAQ